jgi:hypothetical protein
VISSTLANWSAYAALSYSTQVSPRQIIFRLSCTQNRRQDCGDNIYCIHEGRDNQIRCGGSVESYMIIYGFPSV